MIDHKPLIDLLADLKAEKDRTVHLDAAQAYLSEAITRLKAHPEALAAIAQDLAAKAEASTTGGNTK